MKANSRTIVITAVLTAIGTAIVTTWVPGLLSWAIDWIREKPLLVVEVQSSHVPVPGVDIAVARVDPPEHFRSWADRFKRYRSHQNRQA